MKKFSDPSISRCEATIQGVSVCIIRNLFLSIRQSRRLRENKSFSVANQGRYLICLVQIFIYLFIIVILIISYSFATSLASIAKIEGSSCSSFKQGCTGYIRPFSISGQIPDIEIIRPDIQQFNLLFLTKKIPLKKQTRA